MNQLLSVKHTTGDRLMEAGDQIAVGISSYCHLLTMVHRIRYNGMMLNIQRVLGTEGSTKKALGFTTDQLGKAQ